MNKSINTIINHNLNYYCSNNNTIKLSDNGTRHSLCKAHIKYDKDSNIFIFMNEHSSKCNIINKVSQKGKKDEKNEEFLINLEIEIIINIKKH